MVSIGEKKGHHKDNPNGNCSSPETILQKHENFLWGDLNGART
jgi:hypothetical protein